MSKRELECWVKAWNDKFHQLAEFKRKFGRLPQKRSDNPSLYRWMTRQRKNKGTGTFDLERRDKLTSIGVEWKQSGAPKTIPSPVNCRDTRKEKERAKNKKSNGRTGKVKSAAAEQRRKKLDQVWMGNLKKLKKFKAAHGHLKVPWIGDQHQLCQWVNSQRRDYRAKTLSDNRYKKLDALGFDWTSRKPSGPKSVKRSWEVMYDELKAYKREYKHVDVSNKENRELHIWLNQQKQQIESRALENPKRKKLIQLGVDLNLPTQEEWCNRLWSKQYDELRFHKEKNGHIRVPKHESKSLHEWLKYQRRRFREGQLLEDRLDRLNALDDSWLEPSNNKVSKQEDKNSHVAKAKSKVPPAKRVNIVARTQKPAESRQVKANYKSTSNGRTDYKVQQTGAKRPISKKWDKLWKRNLEKMKKFKAAHGHLKVPRTGLSQWMHDQRKNYRHQKLSEEQYKKLDALGFDWTSRKTSGPKSVKRSWEVMYDELKAYKREYKHVDVSNKENGELYSWLNQQKQQIESRTLEKSKRRKLTSLGVDLNLPTHEEWLNIQWSKQYDELRFHKEKNGHIRVSKHNKTLYNWVETQRRRFREGQLLEDRLDRLNALDDSWLEPSSNKMSKQDDEKEHVAKAPRSKVPPPEQTNIAARTQETAESRQVKDKSKSCNDVAWDNKYEELVAYKTNHGHLYISKEENYPLQHWLSRQRQRYRAGKLEPDRYYRLNELGKGWLDRTVAKEPEDEPTTTGGVLFEQWMEHFVKLETFVALNGSDMMPPWRDPLNKWIRRQRGRYHALTLEDERVALLNGIDFPWIAPVAPKATSKRNHEEALGFSEQTVATSSKRLCRGKVEKKESAATKPADQGINVKRRGKVEMKPAAATADRTVEAASPKGDGELESVATTDQAARVDELVIRPRFTPTQRPRDIPNPVTVWVPNWTTVSTSDLNDVITRLLNGSIVDKDTAYKSLKVQRF